MTTILVHRRADEVGRKLGFMEVDDKLAQRLIRKGAAKLARRQRARPAPAAKPANDPGQHTEAATQPMPGEQPPTPQAPPFIQPQPDSPQPGEPGEQPPAPQPDPSQPDPSQPDPSQPDPPQPAPPQPAPPQPAGKKGK